MGKRNTFVVALLWAVFVMVVVHFTAFPGSVPDFSHASGGGILLDAVPAFTPDAIYERLAGYGDAGRTNYAFRNVSVDVILPLSLLPFFVLLMRRAAKAASIDARARVFLLLIPVLYVVFDFFENAVVLMLLAHYPSRMDRWATLLPALTIVKRIASLLALIVPLAILSVLSVRTRTGSGAPPALST